jgi:hypothetical protein
MFAVEKAAALLIAVVVVARLRRQSWRWQTASGAGDVPR